MTTAIDRVLTALDQVGSQYLSGQRKAHCPAHDDHNPSLGVKYENGCVVLRCYAGCDTADVLAALGLTWSDLFDEPKQRDHSTNGWDVAASYYYENERGERVIRVDRVYRDGKKIFPQYHANGNGWVKGLGDVKPLLYRYPQLLEALNRNEPIDIAEGEKCVHALEAAGRVATTNPMGAGKWRDEYSAIFAGYPAPVTIYRDKDEAGVRHAEQVRLSLERAGATSVRIVEAADGFHDIADHLAAGRGTDEAVEVVPGPAQGTTGDEDPPTKYETNETNESTKKRPPELHPAAYHGVLGEVVRKLEPATEATPAAMLVQLIACIGAYIGDQVTTLIGGSLHPVRVWPLIIGPTSSGRKGESKAQVQRFVNSFSSLLSYFVDQESGLSTGEGLLHRLAGKEGDDTGKVLILWETEFGRPLAASRRDTNTLSHVMRDLWDSGEGYTLTKGDPVKVKGAHLMVSGHITPTELRVKLTEVDISGGLANRFLSVWSRRTKLLAEQVEEPDTIELAARVADRVDWAQRLGTVRIPRAKAAAGYWRRVYTALAEQEVDGPLGELLARAPAYVLRIALAYALMDKRRQIGVVHLRAALAVVAYAIDTTLYVFGDTSGTGDLGRLSQALRAAGSAGMSRAEISKLFSNNRSAETINALVAELVAAGDAEEHEIATGRKGRPEVRTVWVSKPRKHPLAALLDEPVSDDESNETNHSDSGEADDQDLDQRISDFPDVSGKRETSQSDPVSRFSPLCPGNAETLSANGHRPPAGGCRRCGDTSSRMIAGLCVAHAYQAGGAPEDEESESA